MKHSILCLDDEVDNVDALERLFRKKYSVLKATSGKEGLALLDENRVSVIISDQRMPNMTGVEFLQKSLRTHPDAVRILLTGYTDIESVIAAINSGQIYRYVTKPWDPVDLSTAVDRAIERFEIQGELRAKNLALTEALEDLKVLDEAKNNFMVLVNHELRTPLTSILSFSELLAQTKLDDDQSLYLNRVRAASSRLQEMVADVLEFVSAETKLTRPDLKKVAVQDLFSPLPDHVSKLVENKQLELVPDLENAKVKADEKLLRNVAARLVHNAAKFSPEGGKIQIKGELAGDRYRFAISNPGKPIAEITIRQILKPFTLNESIMHHSQGIGMGLSVSQSLLRLHESTLDIRCAKGRIEVSFELPKA